MAPAPPWAKPLAEGPGRERSGVSQPEEQALVESREFHPGGGAAQAAPAPPHSRRPADLAHGPAPPPLPPRAPPRRLPGNRRAGAAAAGAGLPAGDAPELGYKRHGCGAPGELSRTPSRPSARPPVRPRGSGEAAAARSSCAQPTPHRSCPRGSTAPASPARGELQRPRRRRSGPATPTPPPPGAGRSRMALRPARRRLAPAWAAGARRRSVSGSLLQPPGCTRRGAFCRAWGAAPGIRPRPPSSPLPPSSPAPGPGRAHAHWEAGPGAGAGGGAGERGRRSWSWSWSWSSSLPLQPPLPASLL